MDKRVIVCAAIRFNGSIVVCGARHYDMVMHGVIAQLGPKGAMMPEEQGFIDNKGLFHSRASAFEVATAAGQIIKKTGPADCKVLYSEDLY